MKAFLRIVIGFGLGVFATFVSEVDRRVYIKDKHETEIQTWRDSLAKCNGKLKNHVCYPPYKND